MNKVGYPLYLTLMIQTPTEHYKDGLVDVFARILKVPLPLGTHMLVAAGGQCADFTLDGLFSYDLTEEVYNECNVAYTLPITNQEYIEIEERAVAMGNTKVRLDVLDLWRAGLGMKPHGLICSTAVANLVGRYDPNIYLPHEVLFDFIEHHPGGYLCSRMNGEMEQVRSSSTLKYNTYSRSWEVCS